MGDSLARPDGLFVLTRFLHANRKIHPGSGPGQAFVGNAIEDISAGRHAGSTKLHRSRNQRTISVTASGTSSDVTSALRLIAIPENTPATAST
jgi:hypothetical protein